MLSSFASVFRALQSMAITSQRGTFGSVSNQIKFFIHHIPQIDPGVFIITTINVKIKIRNDNNECRQSHNKK